MDVDSEGGLQHASSEGRPSQSAAEPFQGTFPLGNADKRMASSSRLEDVIVDGVASLDVTKLTDLQRLEQAKQRAEVALLIVEDDGCAILPPFERRPQKNRARASRTDSLRSAHAQIPAAGFADDARVGGERAEPGADAVSCTHLTLPTKA